LKDNKNVQLIHMLIMKPIRKKRPTINIISLLTIGWAPRVAAVWLFVWQFRMFLPV